MCNTLVLATTDFKDCIMECEALGNGIGVVLMQDDQPITFESHQLKGEN